MKSEEITVDKKEESGKKAAVEKDKATWQFRYKNYVEVLPWEDSDGQLLASGKKKQATLKCRNWRITLDLSDPDQKKRHEYLLKNQAKSASYWQLQDVKETDKISERAASLERLMNMSLPQLMAVLTPDELLACGLQPNCSEKMKLVMAIIDTKKFTS